MVLVGGSTCTMCEKDQKLDGILLVGGGRSTTNQTHIGGIFISWMDMY